MSLAFRQQQFRQAVAGNFDQDLGTAYYSSQRDIDATSEFSHHNERPFVSPRQATRELIEHNDPRRPLSSHEASIYRRLQWAVAEAKSGFWHPDLIIKCFWDLDTMFFRGALRGNVRITWQDGGDYVFLAGRREIFLARTLPLRGGRAEIFLNARRLLLNPPAGLDPLEALFESTLHEMCHAFEDVRVREEERSIRDCHDLEFGSRLHAVFRRARGVLRLDDNRTWAEFDRCWEDRNVFGR